MWDEYVDAETPFIPVWSVDKKDSPVWRLTQEEARILAEKGYVRFQQVGAFSIVHVEYTQNSIKALFIGATPIRDYRN